MKERPILFSGPMVRALLEGRKTQTRRVLKPQPDMSILKPEFQDPGLWEFRKRFMVYADDWSGYEHAMYRKTERGDPDLPVYQHRSPFGEPSDRLWVRETWQGPLFEEAEREAYLESREDFHSPKYCEYAADGGPPPEFVNFDDELVCRWRPSIHMPRWASRITLEVTGVRVERLQDISEADAIAEGVDRLAAHSIYWRDYQTHTFGPNCDDYTCLSARESYQTLWDSLNDARGYGSDVNPWVWVVEFQKVGA